MRGEKQIDIVVCPVCTGIISSGKRMLHCWGICTEEVTSHASARPSSYNSHCWIRIPSFQLIRITVVSAYLQSVISNEIHFFAHIYMTSYNWACKDFASFGHVCFVVRYSPVLCPIIVVVSFLQVLGISWLFGVKTVQKNYYVSDRIPKKSRIF